MKKLLCLIGVFIFGLTIFIATGGRAYADTINYNNVISDTVFDDYGSMNASQIDAFLNSFPNSCLSTNNGFSAPDPTGYSPSTKYTYGGNVSAGTVIYHVAQAYEINPQVLLATLQKEQGLVVGDGPNIIRNANRPGDCGALAISASLGYNCPDGLRLTGYSGFTLYAWRGSPVTSVAKTCVENAAYVGFSRQVVNAAWLFTFDRHRSEGQRTWYINKPNWNNSDDLGFCYSGPMTQGTFAVCPSGSAAYYDGYISIDGTAVHMDNGATAALYHYTPHKHGQLLFFNAFTSWFGTTQSTSVVRTVQNPTVYLLSGTYKYPIATYDMLSQVNQALGPVSFVSQSTLDGYTTGPTMNHSIKSPSNSTVYFMNNGVKYPFQSCDTMIDYGLYCGGQITLTDAQVGMFKSGSTLGNFIHGTDGQNYYVKSNAVHEIYDSASLQAIGITPGSYVTTSISGPLSYIPLATPIIRDNTIATSTATGSAYFYAGSKFTYVPGDLAKTKAFSSLPKAPLTSASLNSLPINRSFYGLVAGSDGSKYVLDSQGKTKLTDPTSWPPSFVMFNDTFLSQTPNSSQPTNTMFIKSVSEPTIYKVISGQKDPILSWTDFINLHSDHSSVFSTLPDSLVNSLSAGTGLVAPGTLIKSRDSATVYLVGAMFKKSPLPTWAVGTDLGLTNYLELPASTVNAYSTQSTASTFIKCGTTNYVGNNGQLYVVTSQNTTDYGWSGETYQTLDPLACSNLQFATHGLAKFVRTSNNVTVYYVNGGEKHPLKSYATYASLGGDPTVPGNTLIVSDNFLNLIPAGSPLP